uniref:Uncharacterized protein n=1 Tax=Parascaris univalens TaxID=6257 RepID=A0A915BIV1_PARUN
MSFTDFSYLSTGFLGWCLMLSAEASVVVMLILCAHERPANAALSGGSALAVTIDARTRNTSRESSESSVTPEGTQEKNQTSPINTPTKPIRTSETPVDCKQQAKPLKIQPVENTIDGKHPLKVEANVSKSKSTDEVRATQCQNRVNKEKLFSSNGERADAISAQCTTKSTKIQATISLETKDDERATKRIRSANDADLLSDQEAQQAKDLAKTLQDIPSLESMMRESES